MNPRRRRFLPKPEPIPEGKMLFGDDILDPEQLQNYCASVIDEPIDEQPFWHNDPSYNWNRKHGRPSKPSR